MAESVWRGRAPIWLRILTGILLFPALWIALNLGVTGLFMSSESSTPPWLLLAAGIPAGLASWVIVRKSSAPVAVALALLALFVLGWFLQMVLLVARYYQDTEPFLGP
jgi:hypothetical protein